MNRKRKLCAAALSLCLSAAALFSLSGCGGSAPDAEPASDGESAAVEETVAEESGGEVTDTELSVTGGTISGTAVTVDVPELESGTKTITENGNSLTLSDAQWTSAADEDANLESLAVYHSEDRGTEVVIKATGEVSVETMTDVLKNAGFDPVHVIQTSKEGRVIVWTAPEKQKA